MGLNVIFPSYFCAQYVEFTIHRGVLGATKELQHVVLEYRGDAVQPGRRSKFDSSQSLVLPPMPTTLVGVCRLINIYYALHVSFFPIRFLPICLITFNRIRAMLGVIANGSCK